MIKNQSKEDRSEVRKPNTVGVAIIIFIIIMVVALILMYYFKTTKYNQAKEFKASGRYEEAFELLKDIKSFKDSRNIIYEIEQEYPNIIKLYEPGEAFVLGKYEQDNNIENGKEPIEWIVLENDNGKIYAISKYVLDVQPFNKTIKEDCTLDDWLDRTFRKNAFQSSESEIVTRVELLSEKYYNDAQPGYQRDKKTISFTPYALSLKPEHWSDSCYDWWVMPNSGDLESDYRDVNAPAGCTDFHGLNRYNTVTDQIGVRPVIWLFTDIKDLPELPKFSGEIPYGARSESGGSSSSSSGKCTACNGTGKKLVEWYSFGDWGDVSYTSYDCPSCGGTGRK